MTSPQLVPGATVTGTYLDTNYTGYSLVPKKLTRYYQLYISTAQNQTTDVASFQSNLVAAATAAQHTKHDASIDWWHSYWDRSYIIINPHASSSDAGFQVFTISNELKTQSKLIIIVRLERIISTSDI